MLSLGAPEISHDYESVSVDNCKSTIPNGCLGLKPFWNYSACKYSSKLAKEKKK